MRLFTVFAVANKPLDNRYLEGEIKQANEWITYSLRKNSVYFGWLLFGVRPFGFLDDFAQRFLSNYSDQALTMK